MGDGSEDIIKKKEIAIENVQITLSVDAASSLSFQIINAFELPGYSVKSDVKDSFSVGLDVPVVLVCADESECTRLAADVTALTGVLRS